MTDTPNLEIKERKNISVGYTWDLSKLCPDDGEWEISYKKFQELLAGIEQFKGTLGSSATALRDCLQYMKELGIMSECLGYYSHLKVTENVADGTSQARFARYMQVASQMEALASYQTPEIQAIPDDKMEEFYASYELGDFIIPLKKIRRFKPYILSAAEEKILALQAEADQAMQRTFNVLTNADFTFGTIDTPQGKKPLSLSTYNYFMEHQDRQIRKTAYQQFYDVFNQHKNTLASLYEGSVQQDIYKARVRNFPSARAAALFPDKVPESVYDVLIGTIHENLDALHRYYDIRMKALKLTELKPYDVYASLARDVHVRHAYEEAVTVVIKALKPLGEEYCTVLKEGLLGRWVDRYENKGKRSGAFSAGTYVGDPYILLNYKEDIIRDVFTLAHEAGHSMHSWYSARHNPFQYYNYTIFEAEVASTFNEQLLADHLMKTAKTKEMKLFLTGKLVDDIIATIFRQTMFAEYEHITHRVIEEGNALTLDVMRQEYRKLLEQYFGSAMKFEDLSDLEGLRIPHFYNAFYVYKYATGLAAAIELSRKVMDGGEKEKDAYINFLKSGGSKYPLESLQLAGVDMQSPEPIIQALKKFRSLLNDLEELLL